MKKSYLSCAVLASLLFSVDMVDAGLFSRNKEKGPTVAQSILGDADLKAFLKVGKTELSKLRDYTKAQEGLPSKILRLSTDKKAYSDSHASALPSVVCAPLSVTIYTKTMISANSYVEDGVNSLVKAKKESSREETQGRQLIQQGVSLSGIAQVALEDLRTRVVIVNRYLSDKKHPDTTNKGKIKDAIQDILRILEGKKDGTGELAAEKDLKKKEKTWLMKFKMKI